MPPSLGEFGNIFPGHHHPLWPDPVLIWPPDSDIKDQPVQPSPADVRVAEFMKLPGTGQQKITRMQIIGFLIHDQIACAGLKKNNFDSLVPVWIQPPILRSIRIPETNAIQPGQYILGH